MDQERFVNETKARLQPGQQPATEWSIRLSANARKRSNAARQPSANQGHRRGHMLPARMAFLLVCAALPWSLTAQNAAADPAPVAMSNSLQPAMAQVNQAVSNLDIKHWKAPNSVKSAAAGDVTSIQHDLSGTLATLVSQAQASPSSVPPSFAVYRNVNALYDTLLRVVETADLSAPDQDVSALESALRQLEQARSELGDRLQAATQAQQSEVVRLRTVIAKAAAAPPPPPKTIVVNDGPAKKETTPAHHHTTKKPAAKPTDPNQKPNPQ